MLLPMDEKQFAFWKMRRSGIGWLKRCRNGMHLSKRLDLLLLIAGLGFIAFNRGRTGFIPLGMLLFGAGVFLLLRTPAGTGIASGSSASGEDHGWTGAFRFLLGIIGEFIGIMMLGMM